MIDIRAIARALGGDVAGRNSVSCPGPGHSPRDRSLSVTFGAGADFVVFSHAGDAWDVCKDYVRQRLGWPQWQPGDGRDRRVDPSRVRAFDRALLEAESEQRELTADDWERINKKEVAEFARYLKSTPPSEGSHGVFYPGEIEYLREQERRKIGIEIEDATWDKLRSLAAEYKIAGELGLA